MTHIPPARQAALQDPPRLSGQTFPTCAGQRAPPPCHAGLSKMAPADTPPPQARLGSPAPLGGGVRRDEGRALGSAQRVPSPLPSLWTLWMSQHPLGSYFLPLLPPQPESPPGAEQAFPEKGHCPGSPQAAPAPVPGATATCACPFPREPHCAGSPTAGEPLAPASRRLRALACAVPSPQASQCPPGKAPTLSTTAADPGLPPSLPGLSQGLKDTGCAHLPLTPQQGPPASPPQAGLCKGGARKPGGKRRWGSSLHGPVGNSSAGWRPRRAGSRCKPIVPGERALGDGFTLGQELPEGAGLGSRVRAQAALERPSSGAHPAGRRARQAQGGVPGGRPAAPRQSRVRRDGRPGAPPARRRP